MLEVTDIVTSYGKIEALKGVTLSAAEGKITCLLGPNGAGKTTLMMTIAGILKPKRGAIRLGGADIAGRTPRHIVEQGIALVPENQAGISGNDRGGEPSCRRFRAADRIRRR